MRKRIISLVMAAAIAISGFSMPKTVPAKAEETISSTECAYCWDFDNITDKKAASVGTEKGDAILRGTADTAEDKISIGDKSYKAAGNKVLVLYGGSKGSSYVDLPSGLYQGITAQTGFSYSFWIKPETSVGSYTRVISSVDSSSGNEFAFAPYANDKVWNVLFDDNNIVYAPMPAEPAKGEWSFITFTVSRDEIIFYINGQEMGGTSNANLSKRLNSIGELVNNALGKTCSRWNDADAKVRLDDICLYKKTLTESEVAAIARKQGIDVVVSATEAGGANELTDGTIVTDTGLSVSKGDITAKIVENKENGSFYITASKNGKVLLDASQLGIETSVDFTGNLSYVENSSKTSSGKDEYKLTTGAKREISDTYEELSFDLKGNNQDKVLTVIVRIYTDGVAYRYQWKGRSGETEMVYGEASEFVLPADSYIWAGYDAGGNYEYEYQKIKMSTVKAADTKYCVPLLANSGDNWMLFTEADVFSKADTYCASHLATIPGKRNLQFAFGKGSGKSISMTYNESGIIQTPWRVAVLADNLNDIVNATITSSLNPVPDEDLYKDCEEWIKTGTVAWSWWSEAGDDPVEYDQQKDFIDFAADNGWEYVCIDFGWCLWKDYKNKVQELVKYGAGKGVSIILWYGVNNDNHAGFKDADGNAAYPKYSPRTAEQFEEQFAWCESVGVKGVKVDYFENDDKKTMTQMYDCATIAAKHKINVLFHGCTAPRGEIRTFPNILGYEAVRGAEYYKWNVGPSVSNCLTYVYNRNVVGGMDFTPVGTQINQLPVTAGFQLAQVVAYQTGVQNIASSVYKLEGLNGLAMINDVPSEWDETRLLDGYPGREITIARRNGGIWYAAVMTSDAQTKNISLDFLEDGEYKAYIYKDNADGTDVELEVKNVTKDSVLVLELADNSGAAVRISKDDMRTATAYDGYTYYEAESQDNELSGSAVAGVNQFASGMKQVTGLGYDADNKLVFKKITVPEDGVYEMKLYYTCPVDRRVIYSINGGEEIRSCKLNAGVNTLAMQKFYVRLEKGENEISFGNADGKAPDIDRIAISDVSMDIEPTVTDLDDWDEPDDTEEYTVLPKKINVKAKGYELSKISLVKGGKVKLVASVSPAKASQNLIFSSNKTSVATVNSAGMVSAKKAGKAKITILTEDGTKQKVVTIHVQKKRIPNTKMELKKSKVILNKKNQTAQITVKSLTANTTDMVTYKVISGKNYIKADSYGKVTVIKKFTGKKTAVVLVRCGKAEKKFTVSLVKL